MDWPRRLIRGPLSRLATRLPTIVPPPEFPCRIEKLPEGSATIDNALYDSPEHASTWHSADTSRELATLQLLNSARIPYFDRVWRNQLLLGPAREGSFLEVGCGGGIATGALASLGYNMTGFEPAAASLEAARGHVRMLGLHERTNFVQGDAYDLSMFPAECFDGVVLADVLEHLYDLPTAVQQAWRVLKPGGVLAFDTINRTFASYVLAIAVAQEGLGMVPPRTHDWRLFVQPHELAFLLQAHGFLVDTAHFRGMAPTLALRNPVAGALGLAGALRTGAPPSLPLSDFVEVPTLEVQYLGYAVKPRASSSSAAATATNAGAGGGRDASSSSAEKPRSFEPGELARGLREASRGLR